MSFFSGEEAPFAHHFVTGGHSEEGTFLLFLNTDEPVFSSLQASTAVHADATFRTSPRHFQQLLFLFLECRDVIFPFGCVWMTNKTSSLYMSAFAALAEHLPDNCHPDHLMCDYEVNLRNALTSVFSGVTPDRCYFHWTQAVFKNINTRGLSVPFKTNRRFKRWCLMAMALPLLPADSILEAWDGLQQEPVASLASHEKRQWAALKRYIEEYWLQQVGPHIISVAFAPRRTNNDVERFNKKLNQRARTAHPPVFSIASVISKELDNTARDISAMSLGNPVREDSRKMFAVQEAKLLRLQRMVQRGQMNPFDFLCKVAKVNKKYLLMLYQAMQHHARRMGEEESEMDVGSEEDPSEDEGNFGQEDEDELITSQPPARPSTSRLPRTTSSQPLPAASPAVTRSRARRALNLHPRSQVCLLENIEKNVFYFLLLFSLDTQRRWQGENALTQQGWLQRVKYACHEILEKNIFI